MKVKYLLLTKTLFLLCFISNSSAQNTKVVISTQEDLEKSVKSVSCKSDERLNGVKNLFVEMGAKPEDVVIEKFNKDRISNLVVTKKGKTDEKVIVGAHYDKTADGCGAVDNWTGISIIAHLYKSVRNVETRKTYVFVAFDQEEKGLLGSDAMAKNIPKENRQTYCSMVNFDSFGFSAPFILQNASTSNLIKIVKKIADDNKFKMSEVSISNADADSSSFKSREIPAITLSGLDGNWQNILHSSNDKLSKINIGSVYFAYRFGLVFLAKLDANSCREKSEAIH